MPITNRTRFPNGLTNTADTSALANLRLPHDLLYAPLMQDDFFKYTAGDWLLTGGGTNAMVASGAGGQLGITNTASNNNEANMQYAGGSGAALLPVLPAAAKDFIFYTRLSIDDITLGGWLAGLASSATAPWTTPPTNGIYIKMSPAGLPVFTVRTAGVNVTVNGTQMLAATLYDFGFSYDAATGSLTAFQQQAGVGRAAAYPFPVGTVPPAAAMGPTFSVVNGSAAARLLTLDWMLVAPQR